MPVVDALDSEYWNPDSPPLPFVAESPLCMTSQPLACDRAMVGESERLENTIGLGVTQLEFWPASAADDSARKSASDVNRKVANGQYILFPADI
ncbi:hypothetical protein [Telmatospirillum sp.]|uniref:hypothetical protein n=1 Tax=Telmatospirillum sp. TaxID=2079197 RepID=UPI0028491AB4|nr:hypothetical protein [Telmatospirillum sp.]MDR3437254.1 hypothetical protein [Telmatospirillum sp.]